MRCLLPFLVLPLAATACAAPVDEPPMDEVRAEVRDATAEALELVASDTLRPREASGGYRGCSGLKEEDPRLEYVAGATLRPTTDLRGSLEEGERAMLEAGWESTFSEAGEDPQFQVERDGISVTVKEMRWEPGVVELSVTGYGCLTVGDDTLADTPPEPIDLPRGPSRARSARPPAPR